MIAALASAAWLGLLTAISPCPLATNVAAVSYLGRHSARPRRTLVAGLCYVAGRTVCYAALAGALSAGLLATGAASGALKRIAGIFVGPLLVVAGAVLLGLLPAPSFGGGDGSGLAARLGKRGDALSAALLGVVFALSFCPSSAALFFGGLLPLAAESSSAFWVPVAYGLATGIPVLAFALLIAKGGDGLGRAFARVRQVEAGLRVATAVVLIGVGGFLCIKGNVAR